jgi:hypothetical protein
MGVMVGLAVSLAASIVFAGPLDELRPKPPKTQASNYLCGVFLFGQEKHFPVWAVMDKSRNDSVFYDVLYLDLNADGDLTQAAEKFTGSVSRSGQEVKVTFTIPKFEEPGSTRIHTDFVLTWRTNRVSYKMKWKGDAVTMGGYGIDPETYGTFSESFATAPMLVPGHEQPFQFQHWMSGTLRREDPTDFKVFMGNLGNAPGTFSCVDDKFLPGGDYVVATLIYRDKSNKEQQLSFDLKERC